MSWTANRKTTRSEDQAYSLLGLFDLNMPLLYGEGAKAFQRLQEEIFRTNADTSILAWTARTLGPTTCLPVTACAELTQEHTNYQVLSGRTLCGVLAESPSAFQDSGQNFAGVDGLREFRHVESRYQNTIPDTSTQSGRPWLLPSDSDETRALCGDPHLTGWSRALS